MCLPVMVGVSVPEPNPPMVSVNKLLETVATLSGNVAPAADADAVTTAPVGIELTLTMYVNRHQPAGTVNEDTFVPLIVALIPRLKMGLI